MLTPTVIKEFDRNAQTETATATFGLGCFWGPDAAFGAIDGVVRTRVGYAGGTEPDPTYQVIGDHTEVVQVEYDPDQVSFGGLLETAFDQHSYRSQPKKRQYQNIIFTENDAQREALDVYLDAEGNDPDTIETRLESLSQFYVAEAYHQKYNLRGKRWITGPFTEAGYDDADIRESPAAAKLNAHVAGHDVSVAFLDQRYEPQADSSQ